MDLIYTDSNRKDIGVMQSYTLDVAYGDDENDFECIIDRSNHCCESGYFLYAEGEEYGGIIDNIEVNTESEEIKYSGRTWQGILENKTICPDAGQDYVILNGEANTVLQDLIERMDLTSLFRVVSDDSGIEIVDYQMERYCYGYSGIRKMLKEFDAKLMIKWHGGMVVISAVPRVDYSQDDEFDTSQVDFVIKKHYRPVNHLVCLGQGDLSERAVVHLFTDENGGIQPYTNVDTPVEDSDYILDQSQKVMFGADEVVEVYDCSNSEITYNYIQQEEQPADWGNNCTAYFYQEDDDFKEVETITETVYTLLKKQPYDWEDEYASYFTRSKDGDEYKYSAVSSTTQYEEQTEKPSDWKTKHKKYYIKDGKDYKAVESVKKEKYTKQTKRPKNWRKHYGKYYNFYSDGVTSEYQAVSGISKNRYKIQTRKPTDWNENYTSYFMKKKEGGYKSIPEYNSPSLSTKSIEDMLEKVKKSDGADSTKYKALEAKYKQPPKWKPKTFYVKESYSVAPAWDKQTRYTKSEYTIAPEWKQGTYYTAVPDTAPTFQKKKYYRADQITNAPIWSEETYYTQKADRYAVLVEEGIKKLKEHHSADELSIDLEETDQTYDIGDIVGTVEAVTGITATQEVVKKIVKISNNDITITYEVN